MGNCAHANRGVEQGVDTAGGPKGRSRRSLSHGAPRRTREILAYAAALQAHLELPVTAVWYVEGGRGPPPTSPSALVTISPFTAGGLRQLTINAASPLIIEAAAAFHSDPSRHHASLAFGTALVSTGTLPIAAGFDTNALVRWRTCLGLICGPHGDFCWPVPHHITTHNWFPGQADSLLPTLVVWPRSVVRTVLKRSKTGEWGEGELLKETAGDIWLRRDDALAAEFRLALSKPAQATMSPHEPSGVNPEEMKLVTISPVLPILALADVLTARGVPRTSAVPSAAAALLRHDRLFNLSVFFGVPLVDRSGSGLRGALTSKVCCRATPTTDAVAAHRRTLGLQPQVNNRSDVAATVFNIMRSELERILLARAEELWQTVAAGGDVYVCWSGGIDSTAALVSLLRTAGNRKSRLVVVLDDDTIVENPQFYNTHVRDKLRCEQRGGRALSDIATAGLTVTGELGDQIFGSALCEAAFAEAIDDDGDGGDDDDKDNRGDDPQRCADACFLPSPDGTPGLARPWQNTLLPALAHLGLLGEPSPGESPEESFLSWIAPFFDAAPFPLVSTFDALWWLNFAGKYQNVSLRSVHDGGSQRAPWLDLRATGLPSAAPCTASILGTLAHFYDDAALDLWACVPEFHASKFGDFASWKSYKEPLKHFIHGFDQNDSYYRSKTKVGSLNFDICESGPITGSQVTSVLAVADIDGKSYLLRCGAVSLCAPDGLGALISSEFIDKLTGPGTGPAKELAVNPFEREPIDSSDDCFDRCPYFADEDARKRRGWNPILKATLVGKCEALVPREVVAGRTVLDLGACIGAMCHWSLSAGAVRAVAVECQADFCVKSAQLLRRAQDQWPAVCTQGWTNQPLPTSPDLRVHADEARFGVVEAGMREFLAASGDRSFDVVIAAGVLQCFPDPVVVVNELLRVTGHALVLEVDNVDCLQKAIIGEASEGDGNPHQHPCGLARSSESAPHVREPLMVSQLAPSALVNAAGDDVSWQGLSDVPSRALLEGLARAHGFSCTRVRLATDRPEVGTYTSSRQFQSRPRRYFLRCERVAEKGAPRLLEASVMKGEGATLGWGSTGYMASWWHTRKATEDNTGGNGDAKDTRAVAKAGAWAFDEEIAQRFDREALLHIPGYKRVIDLSVQALKDTLGEDRTDGAVIDVGCATGRTMHELMAAGFGNVHGVDTAPPMLKAAEAALNGAGELHEGSVLPDPPEGGGWRGVIANWTLHFIVSREERKQYVCDVFRKLTAGGIFILTEKTQQNDAQQSEYHQWKRKQGLSDMEVAVKAELIKGVLCPLPAPWYDSTLEQAGFVGVELVANRFEFRTWIARKPTADVAAARPFVAWPELGAGVAFDGSDDPIAPYAVCGWDDARWQNELEDVSVYGLVVEGMARLIPNNHDAGTGFELFKGFYFSCPGRCELIGGKVIIITCPGERFRALFSIGGPLVPGEARLPYIDGCTDTLLVSPVEKGAPCLNHLHFPPDIRQTRHTHPSGRAGVVIGGKGVCLCGDREVPLLPGTAFVIPAGAEHSFNTSEGETLDVFAFHPDSDFGPTGTDHPMVNRTIVGGVSASCLPEIQTKQELA